MSLKLRNWDFSTFKGDPRIARSRSVNPEPGLCPASPRSSRSMERPLKAGWLKKQQRSLVKNWQQRYFVLRGSTLTYHKDDKETTVQGVIQLRFSKVNELPPSSDDPGKHLFEIIPLFGKSLVDTMAYEKRFGSSTVPILVQKCVEFIKQHGLDEEGIFRLPGQDNAVKQFRDAFDAGERPSFPSDTDVHTVASLLKLYLRELPEPVVPWTQYQDFLDCTNMLDSNTKEGWARLEKQIALLPRLNYNLLGYVCQFLFEVQLHSSVNKMNVENLATVMGINLLKPQIEDPFTMMKATPQIQKLMTVMIRQHESLFPPIKDPPPSSPPVKTENQKNSPRSFVGWESAEMGDPFLSESPKEEEDDDSPGPLTGNFSPQMECQDSFSPCTEEGQGSPRKRTQTLPTFICPLTGMAAKADALNKWSKTQESIEEKSGTLSEDIFKILDLRSPFLGVSKFSRKEEEDKSVTRRGSDSAVSSNASSQKPESDSQPTGGPPSDQKTAEASKEGSTGVQVNSRPQQKEEEPLPESLQKENMELKATVVELQAALEAERRRVAALEICLKNAERSRDEAQRRNSELQRDIQQFLIAKKQAPT
ncbi:rho GTPase-activating protein 25 [Oryzias melastigma]|uniref:rho GTPase-activating protein 25 n=1 Tax=Oryzias melastigma TaxID=30732 RepID=UPI000CF80227|nr:rho GTPase-activating protein 25 [Oryzias melastigma]